MLKINEKILNLTVNIETVEFVNIEESHSKNNSNIYLIKANAFLYGINNIFLTNQLTITN